MTSQLHSTSSTSPSYSIAGSLIALSLIALIALMLASGPNQIIDPFVRHDDYPALLLIPELYYTKTLSEGRWLNYLWHLREFETPAWLNNLAYQLGWCVFSAATSLHVLGRQSGFFYKVFLTALIALGPQATVISSWFNTLLPGIWIIASYAVLTLYVRPLWGLILLVVFVPLSLMSYSTYPLLLLGVYLTRHDTDKSIFRLCITICLFLACFILGLTLINSLNYLVHGTFGIEIAEWRQPTPASDLSSYLANLGKVQRFLAKTLSFHGFGVPLIGVINTVIFIACSLLLLRYRTIYAIYALAGLSLGFGLLVVHILSEGSVIAFRATLFSWLIVAIVIVRAADLCREISPLLASVSRVAVMVLTFTTLILVWKEYDNLNDWQYSTRAISEEIPESVTTLLIYGPYLGPSGALNAGIQEERGIQLRMQQLTGAEVVLCSDQNERCSTHPSDFDPTPEFLNTKLRIAGDTAFLGLPRVDTTP